MMLDPERVAILRPTWQEWRLEKNKAPARWPKVSKQGEERPRALFFPAASSLCSLVFTHSQGRGQPPGAQSRCQGRQMENSQKV